MPNTRALSSIACLLALALIAASFGRMLGHQDDRQVAAWMASYDAAMDDGSR